MIIKEIIFADSSIERALTPLVFFFFFGGGGLQLCVYYVWLTVLIHMQPNYTLFLPFIYSQVSNRARWRHSRMDKTRKRFFWQGGGTKKKNTFWWSGAKLWHQKVKGGWVYMIWERWTRAYSVNGGGKLRKERVCGRKLFKRNTSSNPLLFVCWRQNPLISLCGMIFWRLKTSTYEVGSW